MKLRSLVALAFALLAVSACVVEPYHDGNGQYSSSYHNRPYNSGSYYNRPYNSGSYYNGPYNTGSTYGHPYSSSGPQGYGRPAWQQY
jgi:hypothetical protein